MIEVLNLYSMQIRRNIGEEDRRFRSFVAALISVLYFTNTIDGLLGEILLALALVMISSSLTGYSLLYLLFKYNSIEEEEKLF